MRWSEQKIGNPLNITHISPKDPNASLFEQLQPTVTVFIRLITATPFAQYIEYSELHNYLAPGRNMIVRCI